MQRETLPTQETEEFTTERLKAVLSEIEPLVAERVMKASFVAPEGKVFKIKTKTGEAISYSDLKRYYDPVDRQTTEFLAGVLVVFNDFSPEPVIEAYAHPRPHGSSCDADRMYRLKLGDTEISVEDLEV